MATTSSAPAPEKTVIDGIQVTIDNLPQLHIKYMETMYDLWKFDIQQFKAQQENRLTPELINEINNDREPIVQKAKDIMKWERVTRYTLAQQYRVPENFELRKQINAKCANDIIWFIDNFVYTYDPRIANLGMYAMIPFILYPQQEELVKHIEMCYKGRIPWLVEKSRAEGLTEIVCAIMVHKWLFTPGFKGSIGSREVYLVDQSGNPDTIFARLRRIIYNLPPEMRPKTFNKESGANDNNLRLYNPDNAAAITGEGGDNVGRGGRSSMAVVDEAAFLQHPELVDSALQDNTDCLGMLSTPNGINHFYQKARSNKVSTIAAWWYKNPSKNKDWASGRRPEYSDWYEFQKMTRTSQRIAQEIDIDYKASIDDILIKSEWVQAAIELDLDIPDTERVGGFDIGAAGKRTHVYVTRQGPMLYEPFVIPAEDKIEAIWSAVERGARDNVKAFNYDKNTVGEDVYPLIKKSGREVPFKLNGIYGQSRASDRMIESEGKFAHEKYMNRRGEIWCELAERFHRTYQHVQGIILYPADMLISIPNDRNLIDELTTPKEKHSTSGKRGVESKIEMKARNVASPNIADAVAYCFADYYGEGHVLAGFDYTDSGANYKDFKINWEKPTGDNYITIYQTDDLKLFALACIWWPTHGLLQVYAEHQEADPIPEVFARTMRNKSHDNLKRVKEWIGSPDMFIGMEKGLESQWYLYRKAGVSLRQNYTDSYKTSVSIVNQMFKQNKIEIHTDCESTMNHLRNWTKERGKIPKDLCYVLALCQMITRLKVKGQLVERPEDGEDKAYNDHKSFSRTFHQRRTVLKAGLPDKGHR